MLSSSFRHFPPATATQHQALHLLCGNWIIQFFDQHLGGTFGSSQKIAYAHPETAPLFSNIKKRVNWEVALHILNFFRYHVTTEHEAILFQIFKILTENEKPLLWAKCLRSFNDAATSFDYTFRTPSSRKSVVAVAIYIQRPSQTISPAKPCISTFPQFPRRQQRITSHLTFFGLCRQCLLHLRPITILLLPITLLLRQRSTSSPATTPLKLFSAQVYSRPSH